MKQASHRKTGRVNEAARVVTAAGQREARWFPGAGELLFNGGQASVTADAESSRGWMVAMPAQHCQCTEYY